MFAIAHFLFGAVVGLYLNNPLLVMTIAFFSHTLLDAVPHWNADASKAKKGGSEGNKHLLLGLFEVILGIFLVSYISHLYPAKESLMLLGALFSILPDVLEFIDYKFNKNYPGFITKITKFIPDNETSVLPGLATQVLFMALCLYFLI